MATKTMNRRPSVANIKMYSRGFSKIPLLPGHRNLIRSISNIKGSMEILQQSKESTVQAKKKKEITVTSILKDQSHISNQNHMKKLFEYFSGFPLFEKLKMTEYDYHQKSTLYKSMRYKYFREKETIFDFGDFGDQFYIILQGKVSVRVPKVVTHSFTRHELFKFILHNFEFINLENPDNLKINEFSEISEGLSDPKHLSMIDKIKKENKSFFNYNLYMNYYFEKCPSLRSYCTDKSKSKKNYKLSIFQEVVVLSEGACFGELALMNSKPRAAT